MSRQRLDQMTKKQNGILTLEYMTYTKYRPRNLYLTQNDTRSKFQEELNNHKFLNLQNILNYATYYLTLKIVVID